MSEDVEHFIAEAKQLFDLATIAALSPDEVKRRMAHLLEHAADVLSPEDFDKLGAFLEANRDDTHLAAAKAKIAEDAFRFAEEQMAKYNVKEVADLPEDVREDVLSRVGIAEAIEPPFLEGIVYDDAGNFLPVIEEQVPQPCEICGGLDVRDDDVYTLAPPESMAAKTGYKFERRHAKCLGA